MKLLYIGIILVILTRFFSPRYQYTYYYSKDKTQCISQVEYYPYDFVPDRTFFTYGPYDGQSIPEDYIQPVRYMDSAWKACIHFDQTRTYLFFEAKRFNSKGTHDSLVAINFPVQGSPKKAFAEKIYEAAKKDTSGNTFFASGK